MAIGLRKYSTILLLEKNDEYLKISYIIVKKIRNPKL